MADCVFGKCVQDSECEDICTPPRNDGPAPEKLRDTGNGPTVSYEEALLQQEFGDADDDGVYGKSAA